MKIRLRGRGLQWRHSVTPDASGAGQWVSAPETSGPHVGTRAEPGAEYDGAYGTDYRDDPGESGWAFDEGLAAELDRDLAAELASFVPDPELARDVGVDRPWLPEYVEVGPRHVAVGPELAASQVVIGYPREVFGGWLEALTSYPGRVDVSLHIEPIPPQLASQRLRQQLARFESSRYGDADRGRLADPYLDAATADAYELAGRVARSETRLYRVALSLLVRASDEDELAEQVAAVSSLAASMLLEARPATYRALQGWTSALPLGIDPLGQRRTLDTDSLAAAFPFSSSELPAADPVGVTAPSGVLYGRNLSGPGLVFWDRWTQPNYNSVTLAQSGAGKSYLTKLELLRSQYLRVQGLGIDPENEYGPLTSAVGGTYIRLGEAGVRINPLDLPHTTHQPGHPNGAEGAGTDALTRRQLYLHTVLAVLLGEPLTPAQRAVADRGIHACYTRAGITHDPTTWRRPAPLLGDLAAALRDLDDPDRVGIELAHRLAPYTNGSFSRLFAGPSTHPDAADAHLVMFSLAALPDELKPIGTLLALDAIWRTVANPDQRQRRLVVVDEAWSLLQNPAGAQFLFKLGKSARKHWAGLALATQDAADVLSTDLGRSVVSNASTHLLLRTAPQAADQIATAFALSDGEKAFLTSAEIGNGLLIGGHRHRVAFHAQASAQEHNLITTDPAELAARAATQHQPAAGNYPGAARLSTTHLDPTTPGTPAPHHTTQTSDTFEDDPL